MPMLRLPPALDAQMRAAALAAYPHEACGLLLGDDTGGETRVARLHAARNTRHDRPQDRFALDPRDYLAAEETARRLALAVVGVWHSHPDHPARPSATDREFAWPGWSYPIVSVSPQGANELRSWRLVGDTFCEEEVIP